MKPDRDIGIIAKTIYDHAMVIRPAEYGTSWTPWEDLDADQREIYLDVARERVAEQEKLGDLVKVLEQGERDWEATHPPHRLLPGSIVPMGYLAQTVLRAGYRREDDA